MAHFIENEVAYEAAIRRNIVANARKTFLKDPRNVEAESYLYNHGYGKFLQDLYAKYLEYGKLSPKQVDAVLEIKAKREAEREAKLAKIAEERANSKFIGKVGDKVELVLDLKKIIELEGPRFSYYDDGISYLNLLVDPDGNAVVYKGKLKLAKEGEKIKVKASIKEHKLYNGGAQTVIQRPKVLEVLVAVEDPIYEEED